MLCSFCNQPHVITPINTICQHVTPGLEQRWAKMTKPLLPQCREIS